MKNVPPTFPSLRSLGVIVRKRAELRFRFASLTPLLVLVLCPTGGMATSYTWNVASGNWVDTSGNVIASNWLGSNPPPVGAHGGGATASDTIVLTNGTLATPASTTFNFNSNEGNLTVGQYNKLSLGNGSFVISGTNFTNAGTIDNASTTSAGTGGITFFAGSTSATNTGTISAVTATLKFVLNATSPLTNTGGTLSAKTGGALAFSGAATINGGALTSDSTGIIYAQSLTTPNAQTLTLNNVTVTNNGAYHNYEVSPSTTALATNFVATVLGSGTVFNNNSGAITDIMNYGGTPGAAAVSINSTISVNAGATFNNAGTLLIQNDSARTGTALTTQISSFTVAAAATGFSNTGTVKVISNATGTGATASFTSGQAITNQGTVLVQGNASNTGASFSVTGGNNYTQSGTGLYTLLEQGGSLSATSILINSGTLGGVGTVSGATTIGNGATVAPGQTSTGAAGIGTLAVGAISFQNGSTFGVDVNSSTSDLLTIGGAATFAGTDNITFTGSTGATTTSGVGNYVLATATSGLTTGAFTGTAPTYYRLLGTGTQLNLTHQATIGTITATPAAAAIITGGSTTFGVTVSNTAPTGSSSLSAGATSGTSTAGSITAGTITAAAGSTSSSAAGLTFNGTTIGAGQTGSFSITDPNADNTPQTGNVTVNVYGHASGSLSGSTLNLGNVHVGYASPVTSSNSVTAGNASGYLVNLKGSATPASGVTLTSVSGVAAGGTSGAITATLATGKGVGSFSNQTYTFADDSTLSGASSNVGTTTVTVSGQVYSGQGTWNTNGNGVWGTLAGTGANTFGSNWGTNQGSPGLDSNFQSTDTATFDNTALTAGSSATVSLNGASPSLKTMTFSTSGGGYTIAQGTGSGSITLNGGGGNATVTSLSGTHEISAPVALATTTDVNVSGGSAMTWSGAISGTGGINSNGAGTLQLTGANTYGGNTVVTEGNLKVNNLTGSATGGGAVEVQTGATISGGQDAGSSVTAGGASYGVHGTIPVSRITSSQGFIGGALTIDSGAHLAPGNSIGTLTAASLTFNLGSIADYQFDTASGLNDFTIVTGALTLNGGGFNLLDLSNNPFAVVGTYNLMQYGDGSDLSGLSKLTVLDPQAGYIYTFVDNAANDLIQLKISTLDVVPEPDSRLLLLGGLGVLIFWQRHRYHRNRP